MVNHFRLPHQRNERRPRGQRVAESSGENTDRHGEAGSICQLAGFSPLITRCLLKTMWETSTAAPENCTLLPG